MSLFRKDIVANAVSEKEHCLMDPDYFLMKYIAPKINGCHFKDSETFIHNLALEIENTCNILNIPMNDSDYPLFREIISGVVQELSEKL